MIKELLLIFLCTAALITAHNSDKKITHKKITQNDTSKTENILESKQTNESEKIPKHGIAQEGTAESSTAKKIPESGTVKESTIAGAETETSPVAQTRTEKKDDSYYSELPIT